MEWPGAPQEETFEQRLEWQYWGESIPGRGNSQVKGIFEEYQGVYVARVERWEERGRDGVRELTVGGHVGPYIRTLSFTLSEVEPGGGTEQGRDLT